MINGICFANALISGCNNILNHRKRVDELNIFPVPDGDTGTNMSRTISMASDNVQHLSSVSEVSKMVASAMLRGARGNSGVILSIIFKGLSEGFSDKDEIDGKDFVNALKIAVDEAYGAVTNPTEGTILTVIRMAYEEGLKACEENEDPIFVWRNICLGAKNALDMTPEFLPVLKRAGVVDAGGQGLLFIFEGMLSVFEDGKIIDKNSDNVSLEQNDFASMTAIFDEVINYTYCTEFITRKENIRKKYTDELKSYLTGIGDCVLVVEDDEIIKVHVHTNDPGQALQKGLTTGELLTVKIENMREQQRQNALKTKNKKQIFDFAEPTEEVGIVGVVAGSGLADVFKDLGCNAVVYGGQTMNPSTDDLIAAVNSVPAKVVYLFPNNKNIILAAEQAVDLIDDRKVVVVKTKTIPQGISALLSFDPEKEISQNVEFMQQTAGKVLTGQVTFAARDSEFGGLKMKKNDIIALNNGKLVIVEKDPVKALQKLAKQMITKDTSFVSLIYGEDVDVEEAEKAFEYIKTKFSKNIEANLIKGEQPIYHFILGVE